MGRTFRNVLPYWLSQPTARKFCDGTPGDCSAPARGLKPPEATRNPCLMLLYSGLRSSHMNSSAIRDQKVPNRF